MFSFEYYTIFYDMVSSLLIFYLTIQKYQSITYENAAINFLSYQHIYWGWFHNCIITTAKLFRNTFIEGPGTTFGW